MILMRRSFGVWLIALFTVSIFVPLSILSFALTAYFNRIFIAETESMFSSTLLSVSGHISTYVGDLSRLSMTPYYHAEMMEYMIDINSGRYFNDPVTTVKVNKSYHVTFSRQLATSRKDVVGVLFVPYDIEDDLGFLVRRYAGNHKIVRGIGAKDTEWYKNALESDGTVFFTQTAVPNYLTEPNNHYFSTQQESNIFSVVRLIKDPSTMRPIGVIKVDATDTMLSDIFEGIPVTKSSMLALLDQNNSVIYSNEDIDPVLLEAATSGNERVFSGKDSYYVFIAPVDSTPWKLCYLASEKDVRQRTTTIYYATTLFGLIFLALAIFIFYRSSRNTVQAMNQLVLAMKKISSGDLDVHLNIPKTNYLAALSDALNQTTRRLDEHIQREYKAVLDQRNAEYLALQSQINPHFLNNILSGFVTLNRLGQRDALEDSIISLSHLFRYIAKNENLSTVRGELTFLEEYIVLQKMRFANKISCNFSCTPEAEKIVIPKLLLQPLVENAIVHGMESHGNDLFIDVSAQLKHDGETSVLHIVIRDDGIGFDTESVEAHGVGITNIIERLELFNRDSVFEITSEPGQGCTCVIVLPIEEDETNADYDL